MSKKTSRMGNNARMTKKQNEFQWDELLSEKGLYLIPIILWMIVVPLVVKIHQEPNNLKHHEWYYQYDNLVDFFLYYKGVCIVITAIIMTIAAFVAFLMTSRTTWTRVKESKIFIPAVIYIILAVLSTAFSAYQTFALHGMPDQFEGLWVLIGYIVASVYFYYMVRYQNMMKPIFVCMITGAVIVGTICVFQAFKMDIFREIYSEYHFTFELGQVYGTFYNLNYTGMYMVLFIPILTLQVIWNKSIWKKALYLLLDIMLIISMFKADSITSGIAIVIAAAFGLLYLLFFHLPKKILQIIMGGVLAIGLAATVIVVALKSDSFFERYDTAEREIETILTEKESVKIVYRGETVYLSMNMGDGTANVVAQDADKNAIAVEIKNDGETNFWTLSDERFKDLVVCPAAVAESDGSTSYLMQVRAGNEIWNFTNRRGTYEYFTDQQKIVKLTEKNRSKTFGWLEDKSSLASGRGYIWSKTIPLLKDNIVLGEGADTFTLVYPNDDYVDKYNNHYNNMIITKPHNMFLQIGVQTGVLSLIAFLAFFLWYFVESFLIYRKNPFKTWERQIGFAVWIGNTAYMITGIANDSTVTVAPIFWALMGVGIALNALNRKSLQNKEND